jgi:hypothetical protein
LRTVDVFFETDLLRPACVVFDASCLLRCALSRLSLHVLKNQSVCSSQALCLESCLVDAWSGAPGSVRLYENYESVEHGLPPSSEEMRSYYDVQGLPVKGSARIELRIKSRFSDGILTMLTIHSFNSSLSSWTQWPLAPSFLPLFLVRKII